MCLPNDDSILADLLALKAKYIEATTLRDAPRVCNLCIEQGKPCWLHRTDRNKGNHNASTN